MQPQKGFFSRMLARLRGRHTGSQVLAVSFLPRQIACFHGALELAVPADFRAQPHTAPAQTVFRGSKSGLRLAVMQFPFHIPLRTVSEADLQQYIQPLFADAALIWMRRGFVRHSPALTAGLQCGTARRSGRQPAADVVLHWIQVRDTVFLLQFSGVQERERACVESILQTVQVHPERVAVRKRG